MGDFSKHSEWHIPRQYYAFHSQNSGDFDKETIREDDDCNTKEQFSPIAQMIRRYSPKQNSNSHRDGFWLRYMYESIKEEVTLLYCLHVSCFLSVGMHMGVCTHCIFDLCTPLRAVLPKQVQGHLSSNWLSHKHCPAAVCVSWRQRHDRMHLLYGWSSNCGWEEYWFSLLFRIVVAREISPIIIIAINVIVTIPLFSALWTLLLFLLIYYY